jgi:hypothetical protein
MKGGLDRSADGCEFLLQSFAIRRLLGLFGKREPVMSLTDDWLSLGHKLYEKKGRAIFDHSNVPESEAGTKDPKVVALTLLARTSRITAA